MTDAERARRIIDESCGDVEDMANVAARYLRKTAEEIEARLVLALQLELERMMGE